MKSSPVMITNFVHRLVRWHSAGKGDFNCSKLISVYRVRADKCNRLWVLDSGINTSIDDFTVACPPKILIFDLQTDRLVRIVSFPREAVRTNSLFTNLVLDDTTATTCDDVYVYVTDTTGPGLVVVEGATGRSWRFLHASMLPHPDQATYRYHECDSGRTNTFTLLVSLLAASIHQSTITRRTSLSTTIRLTVVTLTISVGDSATSTIIGGGRAPPGPPVFPASSAVMEPALEPPMMAPPPTTLSG
ncbi:protein yellow-like [Copidosoma floridanum]|uniref:protein yellow-like n=1 Tax=Copidosoma floridanum TaxID=29053 RepID=UPI000C6F71BD|nr:protein yellow-like [Copidosoma floridanum]